MAVKPTLQLGDPLLRAPCQRVRDPSAPQLRQLAGDLSDTLHSMRADGELGELLQHEIDHLEGVLAIDRMTSITTLCMRSEFERRYRSESPYRA